jgi:hypothetical protein
MKGAEMLVDAARLDDRLTRHRLPLCL